MNSSFSSCEVQKILTNRFIVIIGDSVQRAVYKDLVLLLQENRMLKQKELRAKGEHGFQGDELIEGGRKGEMNNGISYKEVRQFCVGKHLVRFYFVTRCYNKYMETILTDLRQGPQPDVIVMNSCLWDMSRYGSNAMVGYEEYLKKLFEQLSKTVPVSCLVIWNTCLPTANEAKGGFLLPEIEFLTTTLRADIIEANNVAQHVAGSYGFDVLDLHFYLRHHINNRVRDGVHWNCNAHRDISNMILCHICEAWDLPMPQRMTFRSYGSQAIRRAEPSKSMCRSSSPNPPVNYARSSSLVDLNFGQGMPSNEMLIQSNSLAHTFNPWEDTYDDSFEWQPYQQSSSYGHGPGTSRSRRLSCKRSEDLNRITRGGFQRRGRATLHSAAYTTTTRPTYQHSH